MPGVHNAARWLDLLFGRGDDGYALWLLAVRLNVLATGLCVVGLVVWYVSANGRRQALVSRSDLLILCGVTGLAALPRFAVTPANIFDFGGIAYSRLLIGYRGYFATAQSYAPLYELTVRDIEHGIVFNRIAGTLTAPLVYLLCRRLSGDLKWLPLSAGLLMALYPLHILFSASDALAVFSGFLAAVGYLLIAMATRLREQDGLVRLHYLGGFTALSLLTQVRYENTLLLLPPLCFLLAERRSLSLRQLLPGLLTGLALGAFYAADALGAPLSYRFRPDPEAHWQVVKEQLVLNPFMAVPVLFAGSALVWPFRGWRVGLPALLPVPVVVGLAVWTTDNGHGAARIFANALILILPLSAYGLTLLAASRWHLFRVLGLGCLAGLLAMPLIHHAPLSTRYLEIIENDRFNALLARLPNGVRWIIVPDDELLRRVAGSTLEVMHKYAVILAARPAAAQVTLVGLTEYLEQWRPEDCAGGACVFFQGLPCLEPDLYPFTAAQCDELLTTRSLWVFDDSPLLAAPFVHCSIYTGRLRRHLCDPATRLRHFTVYGLAD